MNHMQLQKLQVLRCVKAITASMEPTIEKAPTNLYGPGDNPHSKIVM